MDSSLIQVSASLKGIKVCSPRLFTSSFDSYSSFNCLSEMSDVTPLNPDSKSVAVFNAIDSADARAGGAPADAVRGFPDSFP
jgi:hypothetical protein